MIKVKNTVMSTHVAPRTLQFMTVYGFNIVDRKGFTIMFRGVAVTIEKFSFVTSREIECYPMRSRFCTRICIGNKATRKRIQCR